MVCWDNKTFCQNVDIRINTKIWKHSNHLGEYCVSNILLLWFIFTKNASSVLSMFCTSKILFKINREFMSFKNQMSEKRGIFELSVVSLLSVSWLLFIKLFLLLSCKGIYLSWKLCLHVKKGQINMQASFCSQVNTS